MQMRKKAPTRTTRRATRATKHEYDEKGTTSIEGVVTRRDARHRGQYYHKNDKSRGGTGTREEGTCTGNRRGRESVQISPPPLPRPFFVEVGFCKREMLASVWI